MKYFIITILSLSYCTIAEASAVDTVASALLRIAKEEQKQTKIMYCEAKYKDNGITFETEEPGVFSVSSKYECLEEAVL